MTVHQAAKELGISVDRVYRLIWSGKLKARKDSDGTVWRISAQAIADRKKEVA